MLFADPFKVCDGSNGLRGLSCYIKAKIVAFFVRHFCTSRGLPLLDSLAGDLADGVTWQVDAIASRSAAS